MQFFLFLYAVLESRTETTTFGHYMAPPFRKLSKIKIIPSNLFGKALWLLRYIKRRFSYKLEDKRRWLSL